MTCQLSCTSCYIIWLNSYKLCKLVLYVVWFLGNCKLIIDDSYIVSHGCAKGIFGCLVSWKLQIDKCLDFFLGLISRVISKEKCLDSFRKKFWKKFLCLFCILLLWASVLHIIILNSLFLVLIFSSSVPFFISQLLSMNLKHLLSFRRALAVL